MVAGEGPGAAQEEVTSAPRRRLRGHAVGVLVNALRIPTMRRVLVAFLLFRTAEMATWIALLVWAFDRGGPAASGLIAVVQLAPGILVAPLAAVLANRMAKPRALRLGYTLQGVTNLAAAAGILLGAPFWVVAVLAAAAGSATTLTRPVHHALIPEIARTTDELTAGNTASTGLEGAASFIGPALAGAMLAIGSAGWVLVAMGLAGLLSALMTIELRVIQRGASAEPASYVGDAIEAVRSVVRDPGMRALTAIAGSAFMVVGMLDILAVVLALDHLETGPSGPGLIASALGVGAVIGAGAAILLIGRQRMAPGLATGILVAAVAVTAASRSASFTSAVVLFALAGAGLAFFHIAVRTLLQRNVTSRLLTRIFGLQEALLMGGTALGAALVPGVVAGVGTSGAFIGAGTLLPVVALLAWRTIRRLESGYVLPGPALELLMGIPMFAVLPQPQLESLASALEPPTAIPAGEAVVTQGEVGDRYYVIVSGTVEVIRDGIEVARLGPGDGFGEIALLRDVPRASTVRAVEPLEVAALDREPFLLAVTGTEASFQTVNRSVDAMLADDPTAHRDGRADPDAGAGSEA